MYTKLILATTLSSLLFVGCEQTNTPTEPLKDINTLGKELFHDTSLSQNESMSCATCHAQASAFVDPRATNLSLGASLGDDLTSIADRNAPTAAYASFIPEFHFDSDEGLFIGGQFLDGRATNLTEQAKQPLLNPIEMGMPNEAAVLERVQENPVYVATFKAFYGADIFNDTQKAYTALAEAIATFEKSDVFAPFNSKFDNVLKNEAIFTEQ